jgi:MerR family transcriptional regulator, light-induced transcriptional regulator
MASYSIKDLEDLSGIKAHTIRIWEKRYGIVVPERTTTNIRLYSDDDLKKLLNISILNRNGLKISYLSKLTNNELKEKVIHISRETSDAGTQIENLIISMLELDEWKFDKILSDSIIRIGFEEAMVQVMHPFFEKIGLLWQTGSINPAQEHFVSNLMRQKLIVAIDGQAPARLENRPTFILFLHENELHELGLLFYSYLLKKKGVNVIYLGQAVPFDDLKVTS